MSRAKFEEWLNAPCSVAEDPFSWVCGDIYEIAYQAWLAGRESMRDEAAAVASDEWVKDHLIPASDAIKRIKP